MATVNSNWLALSATLIILQVRESASSRRSQDLTRFNKIGLAPAYSLLLLTAIMHLMRTAQKHVRFVIVPQ